MDSKEKFGKQVDISLRISNMAPANLDYGPPFLSTSLFYLQAVAFQSFVRLQCITPYALVIIV